MSRQAVLLERLLQDDGRNRRLTTLLRDATHRVGGNTSCFRVNNEGNGIGGPNTKNNGTRDGRAREHEAGHALPLIHRGNKGRLCPLTNDRR